MLYQRINISGRNPSYKLPKQDNSAVYQVYTRKHVRRRVNLHSKRLRMPCIETFCVGLCYYIYIIMNKKQQQTLKRIFERPERADISWVDIESLFIALGADISEGRGSRVRVVLNEVRAVFHRPHPKRITNKGTVKSVRRFLREAGVKA